MFLTENSFDMFGLGWLQNIADAHFVGLPDLPGVNLNSGRSLKLSKINTINGYMNKQTKTNSQILTDRQTDRQTDSQIDR